MGTLSETQAVWVIPAAWHPVVSACRQLPIPWGQGPSLRSIGPERNPITDVSRDGCCHQIKSITCFVTCTAIGGPCQNGEWKVNSRQKQYQLVQLGSQLQSWVFSAHGLASLCEFIVPQHLTQGSLETLLLLLLPPQPRPHLLPYDLLFSSPKHGILGPLPRENWGSETVEAPACTWGQVHMRG